MPNVIKGVTLINAGIFLLAFLHKSDIRLIMRKLRSVFTTKNFSHSLSILVVCLLVQTNAWHLIALIFKACVRYFLTNFYLIALQKLWKIFLFHLKSSFRSRDIQIFVYPSSPLFLSASHCFRAWSKKILKVYNVINCLNNTFCVIFWEGKKLWHWNFVHGVLHKEHFYGKIMQKMWIKN